MTLLVALTGSDGLVLAADSRGTFGDPHGTTAQNDSQQKAHILSKHAAGLIAGSGEIGTLLIQEVQAKLADAGIDGVTAVMQEVHQMSRTRYDEWFQHVPAIQPPALLASGQAAQRPVLQYLVAGYDHDASQQWAVPKVYQLASPFDFAPMLSNHGFAVAGVPQYALYLLNRLYERERSVRELTALAVYVITETASQDGKVGGPVRVINVSPETGCAALDEAAVAEVISSNAGRSQALRDSFYRQEA